MNDFAIPSLGEIVGKTDKRLAYERLFALYVGQGSDYYVDLDWERINSGKKISWNWLDFLFPSIWLLYRKFWTLAARVILFTAILAFTIFSTFGSMISDQDIDFIVFIAVIPFSIFFALRGHFLYLNRARSDIRKLAKSRMSSSEARRKIERKGGISWIGLTIGLALLILPYVLF